MLYDGTKLDTTNRAVTAYLKVNSCGFQNVASDYTVIRKNGRKDYHILLVLDGTAKVLHNNKYHTLSGGNLVIYAPDNEQFYSFENNSTTLWCHFGGTVTDEIFESCGIASGVYFLNPDKRITESFTALIRNFHLPSREKFSNVSLLELIYNISESIRTPSNTGKDDMVSPILTYINANYNKHITLDELAKKAGYSKSRFSHIFSETTGTTPIKYQNDIRLKTACELLTSGISVSETAFSCGFSDALYFSRIFKKKYGLSPNEFKSLRSR